MNQQSSKIENGLKEILNKRIIDVEPEIGSYSWIYIAKSSFKPNDYSIYKMGRTCRINAHLQKIKNDPTFLNDEPIVIKVWGGSRYFIKVLRRIFKQNKATPKSGGRDWFYLSQDEIEWLKDIRLSKSFGLESEVIDLLGANNTAALRKEGLQL